MKKLLLSFTLLAILNGCTEVHHHHHTKEVVIKSQKPIITHTKKTTRIEPTRVQPRKRVPYNPQKNALDRDACNLMYTTYKQCYGLGIQLNSTNMCIESGARLSEKISHEWGGKELGNMFGAVCAVACESANRNMSMPSYSEFANNACN